MSTVALSNRTANALRRAGLVNDDDVRKAMHGYPHPGCGFGIAGVGHAGGRELLSHFGLKAVAKRGVGTVLVELDHRPGR
jgi:hypothetical protein